MRNYSIVPHVADLRMNIQGDSLPELFHAGLEGMTEYMAPGFCQKKNGTVFETEVEIFSADSTALLVDFLSKVLTLMQTDKTTFCRVDFPKLEANSLTVKLTGFSGAKFEKDIKAVTYHEADIKKNESGRLETNLVFDI